jgi:hypothetical protein
MDDYVAKPVSQAELQTVLWPWLERARSRPKDARRSA